MVVRNSWLIGSLVVAVTFAACGDDGGSNTESCGDGHVTGVEQCDDGNKSGGDGCSASCRSESSLTCGDNVIDVALEQCDDGNTTSGDGCSATCQNEPNLKCGNGMIDGTEACDDGNLVAGDGCSATCTVEVGMGTCAAPTTLTLMPMGADLVGTGMGDTTTAMDNLPEAACDGDVAGGGHDNIWKFTTTTVADVLIVLSENTSFDGGIRLMTTACSVASEVVDVVGDDGCSDFSGQGSAEALGYVNLPAGTYYLSVDGYIAAEMGTYDFTVTVSPPGCGNGMLGILEQCDDGNTASGDGCNAACAPEANWNCDQSEPSVCQMVGCGDGILQATEDCDDDNITPGDGCGATCLVEAGYSCLGEPSVCVLIECGNGIIEGTAEECDDDNLTNGDRCSSTCILEQTVTEAAEPNNTTAQVLTAGSHIIRGQFETADVDLYTFTLATAAAVEIETYFTINGDTTDYTGRGSNLLFDCPDFDDDHHLAIFPAAADTTMDAAALFTDADDGDLFCSYLGKGDGSDGGMTDVTQLVNLAAGTYTIRVTDDPLSSAITSRRYMLDLKITSAGTMGPVVPAAGDIKINEFLAADGGATTGGVDSNCDGALNNSDDEFIELINVSTKTLDLTGLTIADALGIKFTFATQLTGSLTLAPGKAVVVWGGGVPACAGVNNFFTNGTAHTLSLNDTGDSITLATGGATPVTIASTTYTAPTIGISSNLSPDVTGTAYAQHNAVTGAVGNFSPGKRANGTAF